jgi:hypothetical protein
LNSEAYRDLVSVLKSVVNHKQAASRCGDLNARSGILAASLEEVEACLITLIESIEERAFDAVASGIPGAELDATDEINGPAHPERPFGELSSYFSNRPR